MPTPTPLSELDAAASHIQPASSKGSADHVVLDGDGIICLCCNERVGYTVPIRVSIWAGLIDAFVDAHRDCQPNQNQNQKEQHHD